MIKNLPTEFSFPVTQSFGEHPEIYADVLCGESREVRALITEARERYNIE